MRRVGFTCRRASLVPFFFPPTLLLELMDDQVDPVYMGCDTVVDLVARVRCFFFLGLDGWMG